jgi:hypothetical protein
MHSLRPFFYFLRGGAAHNKKGPLVAQRPKSGRSSRRIEHRLELSKTNLLCDAAFFKNEPALLIKFAPTMSAMATEILREIVIP